MLNWMLELCLNMWHLFYQVFDKYLVKTFINRYNNDTSKREWWQKQKSTSNFKYKKTWWRNNTYMLKWILKFCVKMWHLFRQVFDKYFVKTFIKEAIFSNIAKYWKPSPVYGQKISHHKIFCVRRFQVIKVSDVVDMYLTFWRIYLDFLKNLLKNNTLFIKYFAQALWI